MTIVVGSTNPVKVNAVKVGVEHMWPDADVVSFDAKSGVSDQPMSDEETKEGSVNRAKSAFESRINPTTLKLRRTRKSEVLLGVGLEGGVFINENGELWSTVWVSVVDSEGNTFSVNGARFPVAEPFATLIKNGEEMGPAASRIVGQNDINQKQGYIGFVTNGFVSRTDEYAGIARLAIGMWYGKEVVKEIQHDR